MTKKEIAERIVEEGSCGYINCYNCPLYEGHFCPSSEIVDKAK